MSILRAARDPVKPPGTCTAGDISAVQQRQRSGTASDFPIFLMRCWLQHWLSLAHTNFRFP